MISVKQEKIALINSVRNYFVFNNYLNVLESWRAVTVLEIKKFIEIKEKERRKKRILHSFIITEPSIGAKRRR